MGFASLQHIKDRRSTSRGLATPATFRPQGLTTLSTAYSLRAPAGFVSPRRRSWDSPFGAFPFREVADPFPPGCTHVPFYLSLLPPPKRRAGPTSRGSWASALAGVPGGHTRCYGEYHWLLPWVLPLLGSTSRSLEKTFALSPLTRFGERPKAPPDAPEYQ